MTKREQRIRETVERMLRTVPAPYRALVLLVDESGTVSVGTTLEKSEAIEAARGAANSLGAMSFEQRSLWGDVN